MNYLSVLIATALSAPAWAESRDERLLRESVLIGGRVAAEQTVRGYLDKKIAKRAALRGSTAAPRAGTAFVFAVDIGLSINDFRHARSDKGRGFAVANGVVSAVGIAFPVAGLIAQGSLMMISIIDASLSAAHLKQIQNIYKHVAELKAEEARELTRIENAQRVYLDWTLRGLDEANQLIAEGRTALADTCTNDPPPDHLETIDGCLKSLIQVVAEIRRRADLTEGLARSKYVDPAMISPILEQRRLEFISAQSNLFQTINLYAAMSVSILTQNISSEPKLQRAKLICTSDARRLTLAALTVGREPSSPMIPEEWFNGYVERGQIILGARAFLRSPCAGFTSGDRDIDKLFDRNFALLGRVLSELEASQ